MQGKVDKGGDLDKFHFFQKFYLNYLQNSNFGKYEKYENRIN